MREIRRIAIVNRGEAALRCLKAIRELRAEDGSALVAIALYTEPDRGAPFVRLADEAISLGPALRAGRGSAPRPAYLDRARVLAALRATHADTVWPGWGFVAEDPAFVEMLEARGLRFLGPSSATMRRLGDKIAAKPLAERAGVPVAPWSGGAVGAGELDAAAARTGFPLLVKAAAGGGGRGIRVVRERAELEAAYHSAASEAAHAFGDGSVFLERLVEGGRHIEVQVAADRRGHCLALGLRDCSLQRRHQKVIEEAPPPDLDEGVGAALRAAAVALARHAEYCGVGTVEFLVDADGRSFYFLEVNPRLQVEHGLTEMLTGTDLVKLQIRIARGEPLPEAPLERGHAIEARVCAEDPDNGFMPAPGTVVRLDLPSGPGLRVDCGVSAGSVVPSEFDSLIAKVIAHAPTRAAARARLLCALSEFRLVLAGGATNKGLLIDLLEHSDFRRGGVDVAWLDRTPLPAPCPGGREALIVAAILAYLEERATARLNFLNEAASGEPRSVPAALGQIFELTHTGESYRLTVLALGNWRYRIRLDGRSCLATLLDQEPNACQLVIGEEHFNVTYASAAVGFRIEVNGRPHVIGRDTGGRVRAGAPSVVIALDVGTGDRVSAGQRLGLLETMKIEIAFSAPSAGIVKEVLVRPNERVAAGAVLMVIQPDAAQQTEKPATRLALPPWEDPLQLWYAGDGGPDPHRVAALDVPERERALEALRGGITQLLLGYDVPPDEEERLLELVQAPLEPSPGAPFLSELGQVRDALVTFVDIERLFTRTPQESGEGTLGPSNDARLRMYLRRIQVQGAGIAEEFLALLRKALTHYGVTDLTPSESLERALLRLFAARRRGAARQRLATAVMRLVMRIAGTGTDLSEDHALDAALGICAALRGQVPETLCDLAIECRYRIFEEPRLRREARAATEAVEGALEAIGEASGPPLDLQTLCRIADSPAPIFDQVSRWTAAGDPARRDLALQVLVLRRYAPLVPDSCRVRRFGSVSISRLALPDGRIVLAAAITEEDFTGVWQALGESAACEPAAPLVELVLRVPERPTVESLRQAIAPFVSTHPIGAERVCLTALDAAGSRTHVCYARSNGSELREQCELFGMHPETARRIELERLREFELERLPAPDGIYAFFGRSRRIADDERIFVLAEARTAAPGRARRLHEPTFVRTFHAAAHTLRNLLAERDPRRRLQWNRLTIFVRPPLVLRRETLQRVVRELTPAARHLGLEKTVVRLQRVERREGEPRPLEIVAEEGGGGRVSITWRDPHHEPLRPATPDQRRTAQARRRGVFYPYDVVRLFTGSENGSAPAGSFQELDLDAEGTAVSVQGRPPGANRAGVVFGIISTASAKHPEGMRRVLVLSDPTRDMGALAAPECDRLVAAIDVAERLGVPVEWVALSSGARIAMDSGTENLDATARVVRRIVTFTAGGGEINLIVPGINVGAQSYFDALATMLMHTRGILVMTPGGSMVLTGRRALEASGSVAAEDELAIGGFERIMGPSGQAQYYARDLAEAYRILLEHYRFTYVAPGEDAPRRHCTADAPLRSITDEPYPADSGEGFASVGEIFDDGTNPGRKRAFAMRPVMHAVIDRDGGHLERWSAMAGAETAIVWDAHIGGHSVCLIGIESRNLPRIGYHPKDGPDAWSGATLFPLSAKKVARALNAASGNRPVVILANLSGFDGSPESMRRLQLEYGAEIARAVVEFRGLVLFAVVSRYHGGAYVVFSQALNPQLEALALEGSFASVIGGGPAATVVFAREVEARTAADPRVIALRERIRHERDGAAAAAVGEELERVRAAVALEKHGEIAREFDAVHSVERALRVGSLSAIVPARDLRARLIEKLERAVAGRGARKVLSAEPPATRGR